MRIFIGSTCSVPPSCWPRPSLPVSGGSFTAAPLGSMATSTGWSTRTRHRRRRTSTASPSSRPSVSCWPRQPTCQWRWCGSPRSTARATAVSSSCSRRSSASGSFTWAAATTCITRSTSTTCVRGLLVMATHPAAAGEVFVLPGKDVVTTKEMVAAVAAAVGMPPPSLRPAALAVPGGGGPAGDDAATARHPATAAPTSDGLLSQELPPRRSEGDSAARVQHGDCLCRGRSAYGRLVSGSRNALEPGACRVSSVISLRLPPA